MNPLQSVFDRLVNLLPKPVFYGLLAIGFLSLFFWAVETRFEVLASYGFLTDPLYIILVFAVILSVFLYYVVSRHRSRPRATKPGRVGVWLARMEGDDGGGYLRNLRGQVEQELAADPSLRNVDVSVLPRELNSHDEAREVGARLNAGAVVWGNLGSGLDGRGVGNLKLTVVGGPMNVGNDVRFGGDVDLVGYEMRDVARFVAGYALLSNGKPAEAVVHFDRILEDDRRGLFDLSDALQFGGIACSLATREVSDSGELLDKARRYFTRYRDMWTEDGAPKLRAMGFFNLAGVQDIGEGAGSEGIQEALRLYGEASRLFLKAGDDEGYAMSRIEVARILSDLYQSHNEATYGTMAHLLLTDAENFLNREAHPHRYARLRFEHGRLLVRQARAVPVYYGQAVSAFDEALEIYQDVGFPYEAAQTLLHRGGARISAEDVDDAVRREVVEDYRRALAFATRERFPELRAGLQTSTCAALLKLPPTVADLRTAVEVGDEAVSLQTPEEDGIEYVRACNCYAQACLAYLLEEVPDDEAERLLRAALRRAESALEVVGPAFHADYHRDCTILADEAREKLADRGSNVRRSED